MDVLMLAAGVFLAIHLLIAGTRARDRITGIIGERAYLGFFSVASLAAIVWLVISYNAAQAMGPDPQLYMPPHGVKDFGIPVIALAFFLGATGLLTANPTAVRQESAAVKEGTVRGVLRITRHPFLWGVAIWAAFHLCANGDAASVVFFGTFFLLSVLGTISIDAKRRRKMGETWTSFSARTSNVPFGAILTGRSGWNLQEFLDWRLLVAALAFLAVLFGHAHLFGVSPFPTGWVPF